jgi:TPR repeat protein
MYYYGYGVAQDAESGRFWMEKSANQKYPPAEKALQMLK